MSDSIIQFIKIIFEYDQGYILIVLVFRVINLKDFPISFWVKGDFWVLRGDGGGSFRLHFQNLQKIWW